MTGIELGSPALQAGSLLAEPPGKPFSKRVYSATVKVAEQSRQVRTEN